MKYSFFYCSASCCFLSSLFLSLSIEFYIFVGIFLSVKHFPLILSVSVNIFHHFLVIADYILPWILKCFHPVQIRFIDNTDPAGIDHQIAQLGPELATTLVIVISKVSKKLLVFHFLHFLLVV